jgi:hypothetical protein
MIIVRPTYSTKLIEARANRIKVSVKTEKPSACPVFKLYCIDGGLSSKPAIVEDCQACALIGLSHCYCINAKAA